MHVDINDFCKPELVVFDFHGTLVEYKVTDIGLIIDNDPYEGIKELLTYFKENDVIVGIVTMYYGPFVYKQINDVIKLGANNFDFIWGSDHFFDKNGENGLCKPSYKLGDEILQKTNLTRESCIWMIGDEEVDWKFAENNGFEFIGYDNDKCEQLGDCLNYANYEYLLKDIKNI